MKRENSLIKNIARVLSANFWVALIGFIGSFIFPRILTIDSYALYHTFTLYIGYIGILHLGFPSGMVINYAGKSYDQTDKTQYRSEVLLILTILGIFTVLFATIWIITGNRMIGYITAAVIPIGVINSYKSLYQAWSQFKKYTRVSVFITTAVPVVALLYYVIQKDLPGDIYIIVYLIVYWAVSLMILLQESKTIRGAESNKLLSKRNWETEKIGLSLVVGNYINTLFVSADKQFVKWFFGTTEFAFYSFGMSMQTLMTVFITSIAQPLFPAMARGNFKDEDYDRMKKVLFVFGSFSGCAYFGLSIIVKHFIQKYIGSLEVIGMYFIVFPAMAVINCMYINLYKIKGMMKTYITTLAGILCTAIVLNGLFVWLFKYFTGVALATALTYYIWLFVGTRQFKFLKISVNDIIFLVIYILGFFTITRTMSDWIGFGVYFVFVMILTLVCYRKELIYFVGMRKNNLD